jgi:hypothetical protein
VCVAVHGLNRQRERVDPAPDVRAHSAQQGGVLRVQRQPLEQLLRLSGQGHRRQGAVEVGQRLVALAQAPARAEGVQRRVELLGVLPEREQGAVVMMGPRRR